MYTFFLACVISAVFIFLWNKRCWRKSNHPASASVLGSVAFLEFAFFVSISAAQIIGSYVAYKDFDGGTSNLVALRGTDGQPAIFVRDYAGPSSAVNGPVTFRVFIKNSSGSPIPYLVDIDNTSQIIEDPALHGEGQWKRILIERDVLSPLFMWGIFSKDGPPRIVNQFTVPVGTVEHDFAVP